MPTAPLSDLARRSELAHCQPASRGPPAFVKVLKGNVGFIPSNNDAPLSQRRARRRWIVPVNARRRFAIHTTRRSGEFCRRSRAIN